ncbi:MAG: group II truncated hemoglobin [Solirubrobacterales bacterium]
MTPPPNEAPPTLYDWGGGRDALERWLNVFYDRVEADELLAPVFGGKVSAEHRRNVTAWWCEVLGGPTEYTDKLGGYPHMVDKHRGLRINPKQRLRFTTLMSRAADEAELPADPEFRSALMAYVEWGTRLAMHNSDPDAEVVAQAPLPRWGWGEAPPYRP